MEKPEKKSKKRLRQTTTYKRKSRSESEIQKEIIEYLQYRRLVYARINSGFIFTGKYRVRLAPEGFPDLLVFLNGAVLGIEVKKNGEDLTPPQVVWKQTILDSNCFHLTARSAQDVEEYLKEFYLRPKA